MSQTITVENYGSLNILERAQLNTDEAAGQTTITLTNTAGFAAGNYLYTGTLGNESGEVNVINSVTDGTTVVLTTAYARSHNRFDPVCSLYGNKVRIYSAANVDGSAPADASFSLLATIDIDYDETQSSYTDAAGDSDYWYKYTYYNSTTTSESDLSAVNAVRGGNIGNYASIESIRDAAGFKNNRHITDSRVDQKRQAAQALINSELSGIYVVPFTGTINPLIAEITIMLAAGYLLTKNYGPLSTLNTNEGQQMVDAAMAMLTKIKNKSLVLTDTEGVSSATPNSAGFRMWPDSSTSASDSTVGGGGRLFRVSDRY